MNTPHASAAANDGRDARNVTLTMGLHEAIMLRDALYHFGRTYKVSRDAKPTHARNDVRDVDCALRCAIHEVSPADYEMLYGDFAQRGGKMWDPSPYNEKPI